MNNLKLLFKNKISIIVAAVLVVTLLISATFVSTYAKYTKSQNVNLNLSVVTGMPVLRIGRDNNQTTFKQGVSQILVAKAGFSDDKSALGALKTVNIVKDFVPGSGDVLLEAGSSYVTESGVVDIYWNASTGTFTITSSKEIYANPICAVMFGSISTLQNVDFSNLNTENTTDMSSMFDGCSALEAFSFKGLNTSKVTTMSAMFRNCTGFKTKEALNFEDIDTQNVTTYENIFLGCTNLPEIDVSKFNNVNANNYKYFFKDCNSLTKITFGDNFFSTKGNKFDYMFMNCKSLETIDLSSFKKETRANSDVFFIDMFRGCSSLKTLDLTKFDTANVTRFDGMFRDCTSLSSINFGQTFTTQKGQYFHSMFNGCSSLETLGTLQLYLENAIGHTGYYDFGLDSMFKNCEKLPEIKFLSPYKSVGLEVLSVNSMFENCKTLESIDLTGFATEDFKVAENMFSGCVNLKEIKCTSATGTAVSGDTSKFSTAQLTQTAGMFNGCSSLVSLANDFELDLSGVKTETYKANANGTLTIVGSSENMFSGCATLTELTFAGGITNAVSDVSGMFNGCIGLTNLDLTGFDFTGVNVTTGAVDSYDGLFAGYDSSSLTVKRPADTWLTDLQTTPGGAEWAGVKFE